MFLLSLPMRERGLKYDLGTTASPSNEVAPHAGAWIEILLVLVLLPIMFVAPHAGAWIEMIPIP